MSHALVMVNSKVGHGSRSCRARTSLHGTCPLLRTSQASNSVPRSSRPPASAVPIPWAQAAGSAPERLCGRRWPICSAQVGRSPRAAAGTRPAPPDRRLGTPGRCVPSATRPAAAAPTASLAMTGVLLEHGLVHNQPPRLVESCGCHGGQHEDVGGGVQGWELERRRRSPGTGHRGPDLRPCPPSGPRRRGPAGRPVQAGAAPGVQQSVDALLGLQPAHEQEQHVVPARRRPAPRGGRSPPGTVRAEVVHVHRLGGHEHLPAPAPRWRST